MRSNRLVIGLAVLICVLTFPVFLFGQADSSITGRVTDSSGATVVGAKVQAINVNTNAVSPTETNEAGLYTLPAMPPGTYRVVIDKEGFQQSVNPSVELHVGDAIALNFTLQVGSASQSVTVEAGAPLVNTESSSLGGLVNDQKISELPLNGRNYIDLSLLQAGVAQNKNQQTLGGMEGTVFSSDGAPTISNNFLLDGTSLVNQSGWGTASMSGSTLGMDGIQEYKVVTNAFTAEYGMTMGSQLLMVSKGGTNQFHGSAFDYLRNSDLDARNFFDPKQIPAFHRNNYGGSFGGPIKKDKTFFFAVYEGLKQIQGFTVGDVVPGAGCHGPAGAIIWNGVGTPPAGAQPTPCTALGTNPAGTGTNSVTISQVTAPLLALYPNPTGANGSYTFPTSSNTNVNFGQIRVDHIFSASDTFFARVTTDASNVDSPSTMAFTSFNGVAYPQFRGEADNRNVFATASESHIFTPALLNSFRLSFSRTNFGSGDYTAQSVNVPALFPGAPTLGPVTITGYSQIGFYTIEGPPNPYHIQNLYALSDDLFYSRGKHALKFGTLINHYGEGMLVPTQTLGTITYGSVAGFLQGIPTTYGASIPGSNYDRYFDYQTFGFYGQDDWHVSRRFTVNLGLRYEFMTTIQELNNKGYAIRDIATDATATQGPVMRNRTLLNFSPRAGFAWDVFGNGHTAIRGGFGIYYDIGNLGGAFTSNADGTPPLVSKFSISNSTAQAVIPLPFSYNPAGVGHTASLIDYNAYQPHVAQFNVTVEQRLPGSMALTVAYAGSRGAHLWTEKEGNPVLPTYVSPSGTPYWSSAVPGCASAYPSCRVNPNFGQMTLDTTAGDSWYNALQVSLNKRLAKGLQFQANYTWSHSIDNTEGQLASSDCVATGMMDGVDPFKPKVDEGSSCFDLRQAFRFNVIYHLPNTTSTNSVASRLLNGWWVSSIVTAQTGFPFSPVSATNRSQSAVLTSQIDKVNVGTATVGPGQVGPDGTVNTTNRTFIPYNPNTVITGNPNQWYNPLMFSLQTMIPCPNNTALMCGTLGDSARGLLEGPGLTNWDFSLVKDTALPLIGEQGRLQFRAEFFNILNHANFAMPVSLGTVFSGSTKDIGAYSESPAATAGQITSTATTSRQIQLALKIIF
jgi:hypothetical protein